MNIYEINSFSFAYPGEKNKALRDINLKVKKGEFLLLCGESGCGKTTLLRCLKSAVSPKGIKSGTILFNGNNIENIKPIKQAADIGFVMQNPESQTVTDKVWHEMAFGLESIGMPSNEIRLRVAEMSAFFCIEDWFHKDVDELSGGQKQLLNLASVMAMNPEVIIFDEPTAQLDPVAAGTFLNTVKKINTELGVTVIMAEHSTEEVFIMADRAVFMDSGSIYGEIDPKDISGFTDKMYTFMPSAARIWFSVKNNLKCPVTVGEGKNWFYEYSLTDTVKKNLPGDETVNKTGENAVEVKNIYFRYEKDLSDVIKNMSLTVKKGEWLAVMGGNGAGKTTLLSLISAVNIPYSGKITVFGKDVKAYGNNLYNGILGSVPQNPQTLFVKNKVAEELGGDKNEVEKIIDLCRLRHLLERHPYDISGGEQQRLAMAKVLLKKPQILLLDEPTKGLDRGFKAVLADILNRLIKDGITIITVSHDIEFCAEYAHRCALVFDGTIISEDTPRRFFGGKTFYTTAANKISRGIIKNAVTEKDVIYACGGEISGALTGKLDERPVFEGNFEEADKRTRTENEGKSENRRRLCAIAITAVIIPLTIIFGLKLFGDRRYYIVSLAVIIEAMLPFFGIFEGRKPKAREMVILSVMCAIGTAGRAAFFMIPQFKPMAAVVIISGTAFGAERGFLVGAISMLISNMVFGQGPWTPWQMFAMGAVGFLAGVIFDGSKRNRYVLAVYGFLSVFCLYGLIMNISSAVIFQPEVNFGSVVSYIVSGIPFDAVHAFSTAIFLLIIAKPILEKLDRVRQKYGFG